MQTCILAKIQFFYYIILLFSAFALHMKLFCNVKMFSILLSTSAGCHVFSKQMSPEHDLFKKHKVSSMSLVSCHHPFLRSALSLMIQFFLRTQPHVAVLIPVGEHGIRVSNNWIISLEHNLLRLLLSILLSLFHFLIHPTSTLQTTHEAALLVYGFLKITFTTLHSSPPVTYTGHFALSGELSR